MFYEMRRKEKQTTQEEAEEILKNGEYGVLCLNGEYPSGVPVSYAFKDGKILIHCAKEGHKTELLEKDSRVCFTVVKSAETLPEEYDVRYESAMAYGTASFLEGGQKRGALRALCEKYAAGYLDRFDEYIEKHFERTAVIEVCIERLTGKKSLR